MRTSRPVGRASNCGRRGPLLALAIGMVVTAFVLATAAASGAEGCPVTGVVVCPVPEPTPDPAPEPAPTTTTTVAPAMTPEQARARLVELVNGERVHNGLQPLTPRGDVTDIAMGWSGSMADAGTLSHNDAYFSDESRERLGARARGENVARAGSIDQAHQALMASTDHRKNILDSRFDVVGYGAVLRDGSWWVTEDFLQATAAPAPVAASSPASPTAPIAGNAGVDVGTGAERVRSASASAPRPVPARLHTTSTSSDLSAGAVPSGRPLLVPATMHPPVGRGLDAPALPNQAVRIAAVAAALLSCASVIAHLVRREVRDREPRPFSQAAWSGR